ncbi:uncharacterized protein DSM5745_06520 [Aspergillus mulundensis]|uniref:Uncharacterized protein n=1 Tax=Aspergillus mulundensis TaxID=1810919 RepID=A0A3D8RRF0_9EURO|nr:hypothetical protein DSM5745_06520 [Aspergillus mulundensis]RDW76528.1 hypothetical protein DSM5745_06520 [Aspergillus mulundensis]
MSEIPRGVKPAADVAQILNRAQVPNLLFGWWVVGLYSQAQPFPVSSLSLSPSFPLPSFNADSFTQEIDFIVPDGQFESGIRALIDAGFQYCDDPKCPELVYDRFPRKGKIGDKYPITELLANLALNGWHEIADAHFHVETQYRKPKFTVLSLYKQSRLLWALPTLTLDPVPANDPTFVLTNDAARLPPRTPDFYSSSGPWLDVPAVKTLTYAALFEAFIRLKCRHLQERGMAEWRTDMWDERLCYTVGGTAKPERLRALRENLTPQFQAVFDAHTRTAENIASRATPRDAMNTLYDQLVAKGEL